MRVSRALNPGCHPTIIDVQKAHSPRSRTKARHFDPVRTRHGTAFFEPGLAWPGASGQARAATPVRQAAWPGMNLASRLGSGPLISTPVDKQLKKSPNPSTLDPGIPCAPLPPFPASLLS
jgi:hypothetical protein